MNSNIFEKAISNKAYYDDFIIRSVYNSNRLEDNKLSIKEVEMIIRDEDVLLSRVHPGDLLSTIYLKDAIEYSLNNLDKDIDVDFIINLNKISIGDMADFAFRQVWMDGCVDPKEVIPSLKEIIDLYFKTNKDSLKTIIYTYFNYEMVQPFKYFNSKTGRILLNHMLIRANMLPVVIKEEDLRDYVGSYIKKDAKTFEKMIIKLEDIERKRIENFWSN